MDDNLKSLLETEDKIKNAQADETRSGAQGSFTKRYKDAYGIANLIIKYGDITKIMSVILGGGLLLMSFNSDWRETRLVGVLISILIAGLGFIGGVLISALGQMLLAILDNTVQTSPFITVEEKSKIMKV